MVLMRIREMTSCREHKQSIIVLEELDGDRTLAIAAEPDESARLAQELRCAPADEHPIYDFLERMLQRFAIAPTRITLEYVPDAGLVGAVSFRSARGDEDISCYPSDALALPMRMKIPVYVSETAFSHVRPFGPAPQDRDDGLTEWLEGISPADFCSDAPNGSAGAD